jgi:hypothetical protein
MSSTRRRTLSRRRRSRGWVLLAVLAVLALLSALVAGFMLEARESEASNRVAVSRLLAASNAELTLNEALRALRSQQVSLAPVTGACTDIQVEQGTCGTIVISNIIDRGNALDLHQGGGLQGRYFVYRRVEGGDLGVPLNRYVVRAVGYSGYAPPGSTTDEQLLSSPNLMTSVVEAEVDLGRGTAFRCVGGYECQ